MILSVFLLMLSCSFNVVAKAEVCTLKQFETGQWEYMPEKTQKDYICCSDVTVSMSNEVKDACTKQNVYFPSNFCSCDIRENTILTISEREKWKWVPDAYCELLDINPQRFCDLLGSRTIGVFGDITSEQTMHSLKGYLHATSCVNSILPKVNYEAPQMGVNNLLRKQLEKFYSTSKSARPNKKIDILLMNFGIEYENMTMFEEGMQFLQEDLKYLQSHHDARYHDISYLWRLNSVPHPHCEDYHHPFTDHFTESQKTDFGWNAYQNYDLHAYEIMETLQIPILDITEALTMRADAHVVTVKKSDEKKKPDNAVIATDCLHSCLPGSGLDVQIQMLAHYLYHHKHHQQEDGSIVLK